MTTLRSVTRFIVVASVFALTLAACSQSSNGNGSGEQPAQDEQDEVTFIWADAADADSLHFAGLSDSTTRTKRDQIFEPLLRWGFDDSGSPELQPHLALSWEALDDLTWEFELREGVEFHNGEPFTAEAVKASWDYHIDPDTEAYNIYNRHFNTIEEIIAVDDLTVQVRSSEPAPLLPNRVAGYPLITAPKHLAENYDDMEFLSNNPVGTGPFTLERWDHGREMVLVANDDYWAGEPEIDRLIIRPMPEVASRVAALLAGDVHMTEPIPIEMVEQVEADPNNDVLTYPLRRHPYIGLDNINPGPTQVLEFRQAMNHAVDWDSIIETIFDGSVQRTPAGINPLNPHFNESIEPYPYDPARAEELIREAGYEPGEVSITLNYVPGRTTKDAEVVAAVAGYLEEVGIGVELRTHEWNTYLELMADRGLPNAHMLSRADSHFDSIEYMHKLVLEGEANTNFHDAEFQAKLDEAMLIVDPEERYEVAQGLQLEFQEMAPLIFGYQQLQYTGINSAFEWDLDGFERYDASEIKVR